LPRFKGRADCIYSGLQADKLNIIEQAIVVTSDKGVMITIEDLTKMIELARNINPKQKEQRDRLKETSLDKWDSDMKKA